MVTGPMDVQLSDVLLSRSDTDIYCSPIELLSPHMIMSRAGWVLINFRVPCLHRILLLFGAHQLAVLQLHLNFLVWSNYVSLLCI